MYRRDAVRERCAYSLWQFHVNKCRGRSVAPRRASLPECQPASQPRRDPPARIRGVAPRPIAVSRYATAGQLTSAAMTTRAKYSRYISRPVATANYPQSRAGGRRRRISDLSDGAGFKCVRSAQSADTRRRTRDIAKVGIRCRFVCKIETFVASRFAINVTNPTSRNKPTARR